MVTQLNMADSCSRVVSALNFLTGEGISYQPDGCNHSALEALIDEYFNDSGNDDSNDESARSSEGLTIQFFTSF